MENALKYFENIQDPCSIFSECTEALATAIRTYLNLDGKTIRNSVSDKALHIVSAWCQANQLVLV